MSFFILLKLNYKNACIVKHALRDKPNRDEDETKLFEQITEKIDARKKHYGFPDKSEVAHD